MNDTIDTLTPLFLDVDGVLNVLPYNRHRGQWDDYTTEFVGVFGREFPLTISRKCCTSLSDLPVDIQWLTTWGDEANKKLHHLTGFEEYPVFAKMGRSLSYRNWKYEAVSDWHNSDDGSERFIWVDDEAIPGDAEKEFPRALLIRTDDEVGITPEHIDQIRDYVGMEA